jgi:signal transduction histidine kinase
MSVVSAMGFVVLGLLAVNVDLDRLRGSLPESAMLALVLEAGPGVAALVMTAARALYDLAHHKPLSKLSFNVAIHTLGLAAGVLVWTWLAGGQVADSSALPAILTGTTAFALVKVALFTGYVALDESVRPAVSPSRILRQSVLVVVMTQVGVLVLATERPALLLLALGTMLGAYLLLRTETRAVLDRDEAERTARREAELRAQEQAVARRLQETDQMKDDLLAMVSHELRTP